MLSILIPTYNYDITRLVKSLVDQLQEQTIAYEIVVADDCSPDQNMVQKNKTIERFHFCRFIPLQNNIGRSAIRNFLAREANFDQLLFLDADVIPKNKEFIKKYVHMLPTDSDVVYGGIVYQENKPDKDQVLRWKYGNEREAIAVNERKEKPYINFLTLNFLIKKSVFDQIEFNEEIPNLRCEDTLFAMESKKIKLKVDHVENPVIHLGLETSQIFLKKSLESIEVRQSFVREKILDPDDTKITKLARKIKRMKIDPLFIVFYKITKSYFEKNLLSDSPSLLYFDLYRLGYYFQNEEKK